MFTHIRNHANSVPARELLSDRHHALSTSIQFQAKATSSSDSNPPLYLSLLVDCDWTGNHARRSSSETLLLVSQENGLALFGRNKHFAARTAGFHRAGLPFLMTLLCNGIGGDCTSAS